MFGRFPQVHQTDIDYGRVANTATVNAEDPEGTPVKGSGEHLLSLPRRSEISLGEKMYIKSALQAYVRRCTCGWNLVQDTFTPKLLQRHHSQITAIL